MANFLQLILGAKTDAVSAGLDRVTSQVSKWSSSMGGRLTAAFSASAVLAGVKGLLVYSDTISELSAKVGVSTTFLQRWGKAADINGTSMETLARTMAKLQLSSSQAVGGSKEQLDAFNNLGISLEELKSLSPEDLFLRVAHSSLEAADVVKLMGRNAQEVIPVMRSVADGAVELGNAISAETIQKLGDLNDRFDKLKQSAINAASAVLSFGVKFAEGLGFIAAATKAGVVGGVKGLLSGEGFFAGAGRAIAETRNAAIEAAADSLGEAVPGKPVRPLGGDGRAVARSDKLVNQPTAAEFEKAEAARKRAADRQTAAVEQTATLPDLFRSGGTALAGGLAVGAAGVGPQLNEARKQTTIQQELRDEIKALRADSKNRGLSTFATFSQ